MDEPYSGLLFHEDDRPQRDAVTCVWCDAVLVASALPDERTTALWLNRCCRDRGDRYDLTASVPGSDDGEDLEDAAVTPKLKPRFP